MNRVALVPVALLFAVAACQQQGSFEVSSTSLAAIDTASLAYPIRVLASNEYAGRAPGSPGEELTIRFLTDQFSALGLAPGNPDGSYVQKVPLVGITPQGAPSLVFEGKGGKKTLAWRDDFVAWTKHVADEASITRSKLVFVGYGIEAPEFTWDDYKGEDVTGKTLVMLVNDPPLADSAQFGGKAMTYYGRWTYKYEQGMRHRAAAVLIVHETGPAGYPFAVVQGKTGEQFDLVTPDRNMSRSSIEGWITLDQAKSLFAMAGQDFDGLKARAATREFRPVDLGVTASLTIHNKLRTIDSHNVVAKLIGIDSSATSPITDSTKKVSQVRDEFVVYTSHWDHFGVGVPINGDSIYNGAADNATGTAGLIMIAKAFRALRTPPRRSILFAAVTAEEQGLLGSQYLATMPLYPLNKTVANINMDELNTWGRTRDLVVVGLGASALDDYARQAAAEQNRVLKPDPEPEKGFYYRSDHFNFAKVGVPAFYINPGTEYIGKTPDYGMTKRDNYTANDYHKPSDEIKPDWDLSGAVEDLQLLFTMGYRIAQADKWPEWRPGNEFRAIREKSLSPARRSTSASLP
jgi:Zn-dependent M28 family amino/carboxypeptidase